MDISLMKIYLLKLRKQFNCLRTTFLEMQLLLLLMIMQPLIKKHGEDALSACKAPKLPKIWPEKNGQQGCQMRGGCLANKQPQSLYFPDDHPHNPDFFKGMVIILQERGFHNAVNLPAQCTKFKCQDPEEGMCCCCCILFNRPNFKAQKSALEELIESHGHLVFFYPQFHCELNFIEQC